MALLVGQVVRVRVAVVLDTTDLSVGQVLDGIPAAWGDLVWVDLANSTALPLEFGDAEFWAEVSSLALTRSSITRPAVRLRAWAGGGVVPDGYTIRTSGSAVSNVASLQRAGSDIATDLPGLGSTLNLVRIRGHRDQRVGWTGRLPASLSWERPSLALRKRVKYDPAFSYDMEFLAGVAGFAGDLGGFSAWLGANQPEFGSALSIGVTVEFARNLVSGPRTTWNRYLAVFVVHLILNGDYATWAWSTRGGLLSLIASEGTFTVCGGGTATTFIGDAYLATSAAIASSRYSGHTYGVLTGVLATPAAGGGTVTANPRAALYSGGPSYGADIALTINSQGRVTSVAATGFTSDGTLVGVTGWGACKMEGGLLA